MIYAARIHYVRTVLVEAQNDGDAKLAAVIDDDDPLSPGTTLAFIKVTPASPDQLASLEKGLAKTRTQRCPRCDALAPKSSWGPGYVRCPACKRFLPTPGEVVS